MPTARPLQLSFSSLDTFRTCKKQYHARYVTREVKFVETPQTKYGNELHAAVENRLAHSTALPEEFDWLEPMCVRLLAMPGEMSVEGELAIDAQLRPVPYFDGAVWYRGKADAIVYDPDKQSLSVFDWKTGKVKQDDDQLRLMAVLAFYHLLARGLEVKTIKVAFVYTKTGEVVKVAYTAADIPGMVADMRVAYKTVESAHARNAFPPEPNGLCKQYCPVSSCIYFGKGRRP